MSSKFAVPIVVAFVISIVILSSVSQSSFSQKGDKILLKSRHIDTGKKLLEVSAAQFSCNNHLIVQLDHIPSEQEKKELALKGIKLLEYIPEKAWLASVKGGGLAEASNTQDVTYIGQIQPEDKISPLLKD